MSNRVVHFEITGKDGEALQKFYNELFSWEIDTDNPMNYGLITAPEDGRGIGGGIGATADGSEGMATFYVEVDDISASLEQASSLGGTTFMPETTVMEDVTIGLFADPEGHIVGLVKSEG